MTEKLVTVIVPFLNEEENLPVLYDRLCTALEGEAERIELCFVDDGSNDGSAAWVTRKAREDNRVKLLRLSKNFGHQIAITAGLDNSDGDAVVIIDADLQDPPEVIPALLAKWREGCDVVYAVRTVREGETWLKTFLASAFYRVFRLLSDTDAPADAGDFRLVDRKVIAALKEVRELHRFMRGLTSWVGFKQCSVEYQRARRHAGSTKYPLWKSLNLAWDAVTSFSGAPLRWVTWAGTVTAIGGVLWGVSIVINRIVNPEAFVQGWATLMAIVLFLGGVQLVSVGILGQYVSRIFEETKKRPLYFVEDKIGTDQSPTAGL